MTDQRRVPAQGMPPVAGRYRLVRSIASGGMAEVWEGLDEVLTRPVAVKLLHPQLAADRGFRERFRREAIAAARLAHRNVVAVWDTGEDAGRPYIVMELVRGRTLRQLLAERGPFSPAAVADVGIQVADALQHAHSAGVIHRDVKPANLLVPDAEPGRPLVVKVADFGIARAAASDGSDLTQPGALLGTAKYLAPEQVEGDEPDARSDVYSLGVVLYELLTGRPPFVGETDVATAAAHLHTLPLKPRQIRAGIPRPLESVVLKAMALLPASRYQSAAELGAALRGVDVGEDDAVPAVEHDPTPPAGLPPTFRQTERSWLLPAVVIVALAAVLVSLAVLFSRSDVGQELLDRVTPGPDSTTTTTGRPPLGPVAVRAAHSFDPEGDGSENEPRVGAVIDGDAATSWATETYNTREFGALKAGVGVVVELQGAARLSTLRVTSPTTGWSARVYVAAGARDRLDGWGEPVASAENIDGDHQFALGGGTGQALLVWVTRLGDDRRFTVAEIEVEG